MLDVSVLPAFVAVILLFLIPPGPDMGFMIAVGLSGGRAAAVRAILGIGTGMTIYAVTAVIGVGRFAQANPVLLNVVKVLGAVYLLWLAFTTVRRARRPLDDSREVTPGRPYMRGALISLTNPKSILFFIAVLPQFLGTAQQTELQLAMLGGVSVAMEVLVYGAIGVGAGVFRARFSRSHRAGNVLHYVAATAYLVLAIVILAEEVIVSLPG